LLQADGPQAPQGALEKAESLKKCIEEGIAKLAPTNRMSDD
jgi:hypothetical protein